MAIPQAPDPLTEDALRRGEPLEPLTEARVQLAELEGRLRDVCAAWLDKSAELGGGELAGGMNQLERCASEVLAAIQDSHGWRARRAR